MPLPSESEIYTKILDNLNQLVENCTIMGMLRSDNQWVQVATLVGQMRQNVIALASKGRLQ